MRVVDDEIKETINQSPLKGKIDLQSKLSLRDKQKMKKKVQEMDEQIFFEQTGLKDTSKDISMDNLIKKYERDMAKYEKKFAKMRELDKKGIDYDPEDIVVSEDEREEGLNETESEIRKKNDSKYEDTPYQANNEEVKHMDDEFERISEKLKDLEGKMKNPDDIKPDNPTEQDYFRKYEEVLEDVDKYQEYFRREELSAGDEQEAKDELREMNKLFESERLTKDAFYKKRSQKEKIKSTGGIRPESPIWNDDK